MMLRISVQFYPDCSHKGISLTFIYCRVYIYMFKFDQNKDFFVPGLDYEELNSQIRTRVSRNAPCLLPIAYCRLPLPTCLTLCLLPFAYCLDKSNIGHIRETQPFNRNNRKYSFHHQSYIKLKEAETQILEY